MHRALVGRIEPEAAGGDQHGQRVGGLQDQHAAGFQRPISEADQPVERASGEVLDDVEGDHASQARFRQGGQRRERVPLLRFESPLAAERHHAGAAVDAARRNPLVAQQRQRLAPAAAHVQHGPRDLAQPRQIGRDPLPDLLLGAAVAALQLQVAVLLVGAGDGVHRVDGLSRFGGLDDRQRRPKAAEEIPDLAPVAVDLLVGAGEEGVVVPHDLVDALGVERFQVLQAAAVLVPDLLRAVQLLQQDQVEDPLALPEVVLRDLDEGTEETLDRDQETAQGAAMAADGERVVPLEQPLPVGEIAGGFGEEIVDGRRAALRGAGAARLHVR